MFLHVKSQGDSQPPKLIIGHGPRALPLPEQILLPFELVSLSRRNVLWIRLVGSKKRVVEHRSNHCVFGAPIK